MRGMSSLARGASVAVACAGILITSETAHALALTRLIFPMGPSTASVSLPARSASPVQNPEPTQTPAPVPTQSQGFQTPAPAPTSPSGGQSSSCAEISEQITTNNAGTISFPTSGLFTIESHYLTTNDIQTPTSVTDGVQAHLNYSCGLLLAMGWSVSSDCHEVYPSFLATWTPAEGGGNIGKGARSGYRPAPLEEMFQGNLDYASGQLPPTSTRYIITNPANGRSIVASFGYEIGPSDPQWLGGLTPEAHYYLDQYNNDTTTLEMGRAADQSLPFGPIQCN